MHDDRVYFGSDDGCVYCLEATSGKVVWQHRVGPKDERILARGKMISRWPVRTGVLIDNGVAYFGAGIFPHETVYLCAANAATGKLLWKNDHISQQNAGRNDLSPQGYLLANKEKLFVPSGRTLPAAFDRESGKFVYKKSYGWRSTAGGAIGGSKAMLADGQLFSSGAHHFIALSQKTGSAGFAFMLGRQMTFRGDLAYIATGKHVLAVNRDEHAKASVERQKLFVQRRQFRSDREKLAEVDQRMAELAKGGMLWSQPFTGDSALILTKDLVIAGGSGTVAAYNVDDGQLAWSHKVSGDARGLAAANGSLLVSTTAGKIYAFSDRKPAPKEDDVKSYPIALSKSPFPKDNLTELYEQAAEQIIRLSGEKKGFCLVLGSEHGRLAYELAKRTEMTIYGVESDKAKVQASRG